MMAGAGSQATPISTYWSMWKWVWLARPLTLNAHEGSRIDQLLLEVHIRMYVCMHMHYGTDCQHSWSKLRMGKKVVGIYVHMPHNYNKWWGYTIAPPVPLHVPPLVSVQLVSARLGLAVTGYIIAVHFTTVCYTKPSGMFFSITVMYCVHSCFVK